MTTRSATDLRREISRSENRLAALDEWIASLEAERRRLLFDRPDPRDDRPAAMRQRLTVEQCERGWDRQAGEELCVSPELAPGFEAGEGGLRDSKVERARAADRIEVLRGALPAAREVGQAEDRAEELSTTAAEAGADSLAAFGELAGALVALVPMLERFAGGRKAQREALRERRDLIEQYALDLTPQGASAPANEERAAARDFLILAQRIVKGQDAPPSLASMLEPLRRYTGAQRDVFDAEAA